MNGVSHGTELRPCHERGVPVHCIVLLEDKHVSNNAVDHWQQFLHQQLHFSVILSVDFSVRLNENDSITEF